MSNCLFMYKPLKKGEANYSREGLKKLSRRLAGLNIFPYAQSEQLELAKQMAKKISIQGVQPKFSVALSEKENQFKEVEANGKYILKPQVTLYKELPENEDLTMHLVAMTGVKTPWHGLIKCADNSLSYAVKRFDRTPKGKIPMEDFSQLIGASRSTKYDVPMEKVVEAIEEHCTFPTLEYFKLFQRVILAFLLGNEDLHLKNLSLITLSNEVCLSPVYDFVNSTIANPYVEEEMALSLADKKKNFAKQDFIEGFATTTLSLPKAKAEKELTRLMSFYPQWVKLIESSFLSTKTKSAYKKLLQERMKRLG
jgi:serine/threonine-protein kinase HipA